MEKYKFRMKWMTMLSRCEDVDHPSYMDYGGRGITVCKDWHNFNAFFLWCSKNGYEKDAQLDRVDNDSGYSPNNCKFVSRIDNARNKRNNIILTVFGESKTMVEWSEDKRCSVTYTTLRNRVTAGWSHTDSVIKELHSTRANKIPHNAAVLEAFGESKSVSEWLNDSRCNANQQTLWRRINNLGWTVEDSIAKKSYGNQGITFDGKNISQWFADPACQVSYGTLAMRLKRGDSPEQAMS